MLDPQGPPLSSRTLIGQWWRDICFVHWRVDPDRIAPLLPDGVRPDTYDGAAWVGLIPFRMVDATLATSAPVPWLGSFLETNVRLYSVDDAERRGVVFCSLDAERLAVVLGANLTLGVPYRWAQMSYDELESRRLYRTRRRTLPGRRSPSSRLEIEVGAAIETPSPLEVFLTARFGLHTRVGPRTLWVPNTHDAWPLHDARVRVLEDDLVAAAGLPGVVEQQPDSVLFSPGVRTVFGLPQRL